MLPGSSASTAPVHDSTEATACGLLILHLENLLGGLLIICLKVENLLASNTHVVLQRADLMPEVPILFGLLVKELPPLGDCFAVIHILHATLLLVHVNLALQ